MGLFGSRSKERNKTIDERHSELSTFEGELTVLVNKYSLEALSNTPDFILAFYIKDCILAFNNAQQRRKEWFSAREEQKKDRESQLMPLE